MPKDGADKAPSSEVNPRRAAGQYIRRLVRGKFDSIGQFANHKELSDTDAKALGRIFSGRKQVDIKFAKIFHEEFGETEDHWIALEHKILADHEQSVRDYQPSEKTKENEAEVMSDDISKNKIGALSERVPKIYYDFHTATVSWDQDVDPSLLLKQLQAIEELRSAQSIDNE